MADREKILRYFRAGGDEELAAKLLDLAEGAHRSRKFRVSDFLDPHGCNVAEIVAANFENVKLETSGGFKNAERMKVAFVAEDFFGQPDFGMVCFKVEWDKRYYELSHRDILGAFMGMGCKREILGDIIFIPEGAQFLASFQFTLTFWPLISSDIRDRDTPYPAAATASSLKAATVALMTLTFSSFCNRSASVISVSETGAEPICVRLFIM